MVNTYVPPVPRRAYPRAWPCRSDCPRTSRLSATPVSVSGVAIGNPVVVTVNVPRAPTVNVVLSALVIAALVHRHVKVWLASGTTLLVAVIVNTYVPPVPTSGVPRGWPCRSDCPRTSRPPAGTGLAQRRGRERRRCYRERAQGSRRTWCCRRRDRRGLGCGHCQSKRLGGIGATPLVAVIVSTYVPSLPASGVPESGRAIEIVHESHASRQRPGLAQRRRRERRRCYRGTCCDTCGERRVVALVIIAPRPPST